MTIDTTLVKRRALYQGEVGFFPSSPMAEEDVATAKMDAEVMCTFYSPKNLEALKFLWGLVQKVAENTDRWLDKDEAMNDLKIRAGYTKVTYKDSEIQLRPRSLKRISNEGLRQLTDKIINIICEELIPGMKQNVIRDEVELMCKLKPGAGQ